MTAATAERSRSRMGAFSTTWLGNAVVHMMYSGWFLGKIAVGVMGIVTLGVVDIYIGGEVLVDMLGGATGRFGKLGWAASIATSALLLGLMGFAFAKRGIALLLLLPVVGVVIGDLWVDAHFPTLILFGHNAVMDYWLLPDGVNPGWWALHIFTVLSMFGEVGITFIFAWLFMEIKKAKGGASAETAGA